MGETYYANSHICGAISFIVLICYYQDTESE